MSPRNVPRALRVLISSALALAMLTACQTDTPPSTSGAPASAAQTTDSAGSEPTPTSQRSPELPDAAKRPGLRGLEAFAEHYWNVPQYAWTQSDPHALRRMGTKDCRACNATLTRLDQHVRRQHTLTGGGLRVKRLRATRILRGHFSDRWSATIRVRNSP